MNTTSPGFAAAWASTVAQFLSVARDTLLRDLEIHHALVMNVAPNPSQRTAWIESLEY
jgi:hypothetical protein